MKMRAPAHGSTEPIAAAPAAPATKRFRQLPAIVGVGVILIASLTAYMPISPVFPALALDSSWAFALNVAVAKGLVFGRDIVFTFGPYASAYTGQYHPATDSRALWSTALCGTAFAGSLICLSRGAGRIGAAALAIFAVIVPRDTLFFVLPLAFVVLICRAALPKTDPYRIALTRGVRLTLVLLALSLSLMTLVKGTFVAPAAIATLLGAGVLIARGLAARGAAYAALVAVGLPVFWMIARQPLAALPGFFAAQAPIVSGYTAAMSIPGVGGHPILLAACAAAVGLINLRFLLRGGLAGSVMWLGSAALLYLSFKAGLVRQDWHTLIAAATLVCAAWIFALGRPQPGMVSVAITLIAWSIVRRDETGLRPVSALEAIRSAYVASTGMLVRRISSSEQLLWDYQDSLGAIRTTQPLPEIDGSVDVYSYGQSMILARDLDWAPRPVFQSYSAYTPGLERLNADHLDAPTAPRTILFAVQPIDGRLPALEDGLSWPLLLTHYRFTALCGDIAILQRVARATTPVAGAVLSSGSFELGRRIPVPAGAPAIWARIEVGPTLLGRLATLAYKPPPLTIAYEFADGTQRRFRYVPQMGAAGFVVSPLVETTTDFLSLEAPAARAYFARRRPAAIVISAASGSGSLWGTRVAANFTRLEISPRPIGALLYDRVTTARRWPPLRAEWRTDCGVGLIDRAVRGRPPYAVGGFLHAIAWVASRDTALPPDAATFWLRPEHGKTELISARAIPRGDVGGYFDLPPTSETTYVATADMSGRPGRFRLGLEVQHGTRISECATQALVRITGVGAARPSR